MTSSWRLADSPPARDMLARPTNARQQTTVRMKSDFIRWLRGQGMNRGCSNTRTAAAGAASAKRKQEKSGDFRLWPCDAARRGGADAVDRAAAGDVQRLEIVA